MAISVDTVYQRVLALANKEQRGYITPQEFNLLANQAQMTIFESYFFSKNIKDRQEPDRSNEVDETDIGELLDKKLSAFQSYEPVTDGHTFPANITVAGADYDVFQTGLVLLGDEPCQKVSMYEAQRFRKSQRHMATTANQAPFYTDNRVSMRDIAVYAGSVSAATTDVTVECFRVPMPVNWTYVIVNSKALYNASDASRQDFELHQSEVDTVVTKVLELAGIVMNKPGLTQLANQALAGEQQLQNS